MLLTCSFLALNERDWIVRDEYSCHIDKCHIVIGPLITRGAAWVETIARYAQPIPLAQESRVNQNHKDLSFSIIYIFYLSLLLYMM